MGFLMVLNWRSVIHQSPGAPAWRPTLPLEPSRTRPFHHKVPFLSTQEGRAALCCTPVRGCSMGANGSARTGSLATLNKGQPHLGPRLTLSLWAHIKMNSNSSGFCLSPSPPTPTVPLLQEPLESRDNVLLPMCPGVQHSPWHIVRIYKML